ncbi:MAG TPA: Wzz/FepE/Etk N-terminal domain-containing protein [Steroidobacteraceae bacterium]
MRPEAESDELDLGTLIRVVRDGCWFILVVTVLCVLGGAAYASLAREWFQAEVVLIQSESKGASSTLSQLGGLASLAGINVGGIGGNEQAALAVLRSREFARDFIEDENLLPVVLFDQWDAKAGKWKDSDPRRQPDIRDAVTIFDKYVRSVSEDRKTGLVTLSITWTSADTAAQWANMLVERVNARLRKQAIVEAEGNIKYLQGEIAATSVTTLQQSIGRVLESEMQKLMMARGAEQFAFKVIDRATPPKRRSRPQRSLIMAASFLFGMVASMAVLVLRRKARVRDSFLRDQR